MDACHYVYACFDTLLECRKEKKVHILLGLSLHCCWRELILGLLGLLVARDLKLSLHYFFCDRYHK